MINDQNKLISVVIPTYNRANFIKDAIDTVYSQTYQNFEIIIVDDGSSDDTSEVVKSYINPKTKYIFQKNMGVSAARNNGIKNSSGEYIIFLDSDDLWHPEKLEKQLSILENNLNIGMVMNNTQNITFSDNILLKTREYRAKNQKENISMLLLDPDNVYTGPSTALIRKSVFRDAGFFDEKMTFCEDWDLFFRISLVCNVYNIPEILTYVRSHDENVTKISPVTKYKDGYLRFLDKTFSNELLPSEMMKIKQRAYSNAFWSIACKALYRSIDYEVARETLWKSVKNDPFRIFKIKFLIALFLSFSPPIFLKYYNKLRNFKAEILNKKLKIK